MLMIGLIIAFGVMFVFKKKLTMIFIMPDMVKVTKSIHGNVSKEQTFMNGLYIIDDKCIIKKFWGNEIYYFYNNPNPISFDQAKSFNNIIGTKAQDLKSFHDSDLIQKLFATENLDKILMILMFINIGLSITSIIVSYAVSKQPVILSTNGNNTQIIADAVRMALTTPR
jgi:isochorismate hydrolase